MLQMMGAAHRFDGGSAPAVYYGPDAAIGRRCRLWIVPDPRADWLRAPPRFSEVEGVVVPHRGRPPSRLCSGNRLEFDLCRAARFWLTLESERNEGRRDAHGRVPGGASLLGRGGWLMRPPVHGYVRMLLHRLWPTQPPAGLVPAWPGGKRYAVALTHDVDRPERPGLAWPLLRELLFAGAVTRRESYYALRAEIRSRGFMEAVVSGPSRRREWDFRKWCRMESAYDLRSAFYFAVVNKREGHDCDVSYDPSRRRYRRLFARLLEQGFEVGLHAGYLTQWQKPPVHEQADRLSRLTGGPAGGVRHHYLQLCRDDPMRSLVEHAAAGLPYDTSVGFNDSPGFRSGAALPFQPFHGATGAVTDFVELPMTLADMHLPGTDAAAASRRALEHLEAVRSVGGLAVLNWHVGHGATDPAWREAYHAVCAFLAEDAEAWCATPARIASWWLQRLRSLDVTPAVGGGA
jgi:peptidoglycan/xylan/chitin deacetylase (PgdA/CDA1 family)